MLRPLVDFRARDKRFWNLATATQNETNSSRQLHFSTMNDLNCIFCPCIGIAGALRSTLMQTILEAGSKINFIILRGN